jgi:hypothetical protein
MKLHEAVIQGRIVVKNVTSGEIHLYAQGSPIVVGPGATFDVTAKVPAKEALKVGNLADLVNKGFLVLV